MGSVALGAGCGDTRSCKHGTLFVTVAFQGDAVAADKVVVDVTTDGNSPRESLFDRAAGSGLASIEVDFPQGYQPGQSVEVVLTAQRAGAVIATAAAAVVLAAGCSALAISLGNGVDGGGGDAPSDRASGAGGGAPDAGPGTGGAGAGGSGGAAFDAGVDQGCVFQSAEDCFNGIDDDCNGHTDCDDPTCVPSTTCVPAIGSDGFAAGTWVAPGEVCPTRFAAGESTINATLAPGAGCIGCSCRATVTCSANVSRFANALSCNVLGTPALVGSVTSSFTTGATGATASCLAGTFSSTTPASIGAYVTTNGGCVPQGTPSRSVPTWATSRKFCSAGSVGGGCSQGYVCVPTAAPNHCTMALGAKTCPAGYTREGGSWYTAFSDTRACAACTCGAQTAGSCATLVVSFYAGTTTTCSAGISASGGSASNVCTFGTACGSAGFRNDPSPPSCPGVSYATGAVTPTGEQTLCCF
jgi:hypothetical protein